VSAYLDILGIAIERSECHRTHADRSFDVDRKWIGISRAVSRSQVFDRRYERADGRAMVS
jgi:hypothetical protein